MLLAVTPGGVEMKASLLLLGLRTGFAVSCLLGFVALFAIDSVGLRVVAIAASINVALICFLSATRGAHAPRVGEQVEAAGSR
jgi:hypothetical protein